MPDQLRFWERHVSLRRFAKEGFCLFRLTVFTRQCCIKNASQQWTSLDDVSNPVGNDGSRSPRIGPSGIMMRQGHLSGCQKSVAEGEGFFCLQAEKSYDCPEWWRSEVFLNDEISKRIIHADSCIYLNKYIYIYIYIHHPHIYNYTVLFFVFWGGLQFKAASKDLTPSNRL